MCDRRVFVNGVGNFYISQFYEQMEKTFSPDFIGQLQTIPAQEQSAPVRMKELLMAQAGLGIDIATRNVYILDETETSSQAPTRRRTSP